MGGGWSWQGCPEKERGQGQGLVAGLWGDRRSPAPLPTDQPTPQERFELGYSDAVDVWATGVLAYELLVGRPPFERESREETYAFIAKREPALPEWMSEGARGFISCALAKVRLVGRVARVAWQG